MQAERLISVHRGAAEYPPNLFEKRQIESDADQLSFDSNSTGWNPDEASAIDEPATKSRDLDQISPMSEIRQVAIAFAAVKTP